MSVAAAEKKKYTYEDYMKLSDDERYELIEGELIMLPTPKTEHQRISGKISQKIGRFVEEKKCGDAFFAPCDVVLGGKDVVQPDILFVSKEREQIIEEDNIKGAPDLVVEIVSDSSAYNDFVTKKMLYSKHGVQEYWIVVPDDEAIELFERSGEKLILKRRCEKGDKLASTVLKGFEMELAEIF